MRFPEEELFSFCLLSFLSFGIVASQEVHVLRILVWFIFFLLGEVTFLLVWSYCGTFLDSEAVLEILLGRVSDNFRFLPLTSVNSSDLIYTRHRQQWHKVIQLHISLQTDW